MNTKLFTKLQNIYLVNRLKEKYAFMPLDNPYIVCYDEKDIYGYLEFTQEKYLITSLKVDNDNVFLQLLKKLMLILRQETAYIYISKDIYSKYTHFLKMAHKESNQYRIDNQYLQPQRLIAIGSLPTGKHNNISDVDGVLVGHYTLNNDEHHTGITAIIPHPGNLFQEKLIGATYAFNGFGKSIGTIQVNELGTVETPILLTNTLNVGKVSDALINYMLEQNPDIGTTTGTINPLVFECNDATLNNIRQRILTQNDVYQALNNASSTFKQGNIGAGAGMICHGFKGGIGSSSRTFTINGKTYTLGVLVNSNFGEDSHNNLLIKNRKFNDKPTTITNDQGSIIVVIATNLPLSSRQLKRICKRASMGIARTGGYAGNCSGDVFIAFSTANIIKHYPQDPLQNFIFLNDNYIDIAFKATVDATEEAILNSLLNSCSVSKGEKKIPSLNEYQEIFDDLYE